MKKLKLLTLISTAAFAGGGLFCIANNSKRAEAVSAVYTPKTVYLDLNGYFDIENCFVFMKESETVPTWPGVQASTLDGYDEIVSHYYKDDELHTKSFYKFNVDCSTSEIAITYASSEGDYWDNKWDITNVKSQSWNLVQLDGWGDGGDYNAHHMHKVELIDSGSTTYDYTPAEWGDYQLPTHTGSALPFIGWYLNGDTTTTRYDDDGLVSTPTDNISDLSYSAHYDDTSFTVEFKSEDGSQSLSKQTIYKGQTASYTAPNKPDDGSKKFTFDYWADDLGNDMSSALADVQDDLVVYAHYRMSYKSGFYIYGDFKTSPTWDVSTAYLMEQFSEQDYAYSVKVSITIPAGSVFNLCYYNENSGWDKTQEFDRRAVQGDSPASYCFDLYRGDNVIQAYVGGTYTIILHNIYGQGKSVYINFESQARTAEQLAAYLMRKVGTTPDPKYDCTHSDRYPTAKSMYLHQLSSYEQLLFRNYRNDAVGTLFKNAYDRYVAWSRAIGDDPWVATQAYGSPELVSLNNTTNTIALIVTISVLSIGAIGGYFFIRRRKEI